MKYDTRRSIGAGLEGAAAAIPMTLGGTVILYSEIAPDFLAGGLLAGCLAMVLVHLLTAGVQRPVVYAARFFEAATLATMVQITAANAAHWGLPATQAVKVALAISMVTLGGLVVGALWLARAERFTRFVPSPVYVGFTNSVSVALVISQSKILYEQVTHLAQAWPAIVTTAAVLVVALLVRRSRPTWPAGAMALFCGGLIAAAWTAAGVRLPMLASGITWTLPTFGADFAAFWAPGVRTGAVFLAILQNGLILGTLMFLNNLVTGQILTQSDDREGMRPRDKLLQATSLTLSGLAGASPVSGAPNVGLTVARTSHVNPVVIWTVAAVFATLYATNALAWIAFASLIGVFLFEAWNMWDRPSGRSLWAWLRRRAVASNTKEDLLLIGGVMAASLLVNMVAGLFTGLLLGLLLHAHRNTRRPVRSVLTGLQVHSNYARSPAELDLLSRHGAEVKVFELDSNQFFVSAGQLSATIRSHLRELHTAILDWSDVRNIDTSLALVVARLEAYAKRHGVQVLHAGAELHPGDSLRPILLQHVPGASLFPDLDHALEQAESRLIERYRCELNDTSLSSPRESGLLRGLAAAEQELVLGLMCARRYEPGEALFHRGDPADSILLLLSGTVSVMIPMEGQPGVRMAGVRSGDLVGEIGFLDKQARSATVVADTSLEAVVLGREAFEQLSVSHPQVVQRMLINISLGLASRLRSTSLDAARRRRRLMPPPTETHKPATTVG
jgi:sulfate permease, SulP family